MKSSAGNEGGGGGNPTDIAHVKRPASKSEIQAQIEMQSREDKVRAEEARQRELMRFGIAQVRQLSTLTVANYRHLTALGYPFQFPGGAPSVELIEQTLAQITAPPGRVIIDNSLTEQGSPVLFYSNPVTKTMRMNTDRFLKLISKNDSDSWYVDFMAIMFHEALVLNKIESSRSYPYTEKFKVAVSEMLESPDFRAWKDAKIASLSKAGQKSVTSTEAALSVSLCKDLSRLGLLAYVEMYKASVDLDLNLDQYHLLTPAQKKEEDAKEEIRRKQRDRYSQIIEDLGNQSNRCPQH